MPAGAEQKDSSKSGEAKLHVGSVLATANGVGAFIGTPF
jgi:hypothetical protein